jgi:hypothetical protein
MADEAAVALISAKKNERAAAGDQDRENRQKLPLHGENLCNQMLV